MSEPPVEHLQSILPVLDHNPDVLSCLANLSNDEVFTPPSVANAMLDLLPQELFTNPETTFLDPVCKSGVFLREITKRLVAGLADQIPDLQERVDHILHKQVFGIAITELTSLLSRRTLYCSKYPNSPFSISKFDSVTGNIRYKAIYHTWKNGKCVFCGASQGQYERKEGLETHAYEFIHMDNPQEIFGDMKFDVIIGNPPYQMSDGGAKSSAKPIYHQFIQNAIKLNSRYVSMIIPSRWFAGGKGLNEFREKMLNDTSIKILVDYDNSRECFDNVDIAGGVCYFLRDKYYNGDCLITNIINGKPHTSQRKMNEFKVFIRYSTAANIIHKIQSLAEPTMDNVVSSRKPFGLDTLVKPVAEGDIVLRYNKGFGKYNSKDIKVGNSLIQKWKTIISYVSFEHAGQSDKEGMRKVMSVIEVLHPNSVCSETYLVAGCFDTEEKANNLANYLKTKFVRFLVSQVAISQHITRNSFIFVPQQNFSKNWDDNSLYKKYHLTEQEINLIESTIKPLE